MEVDINNGQFSVFKNHKMVFTYQFTLEELSLLKDTVLHPFIQIFKSKISVFQPDFHFKQSTLSMPAHISKIPGTQNIKNELMFVQK